MADETTNLVLIQLREIRAKLDGMDARFDKMDKDHDLFRFQLTHTFGIAGMANMQAARATEVSDDAITLHKRMDERMHAAERSIRVLEDALKAR